MAPVLADSRLSEFLGAINPADLVEGADRFGEVEGAPPLAPILQGDRLVAYAYLNSDVVDSAGYSGKPIHIVVAVSPAGRLLAVRLMEHHEPIVLTGISEAKIRAVIDHFRDTDIAAIAAGSVEASMPDIVSGGRALIVLPNGSTRVVEA